MKFVIIADIHDNLKNLNKCLNWCKREIVDGLICCGDLANSETLRYLVLNFKNDIFLVRGNLEIYDKIEVNLYDNINYLGKYGVVRLDGKKIGICHEPVFIDKIIEQGNCQLIFYGHTHKPWIDKRDNITIVNPGTLGGVFTKATFAVWQTETNNLELKILELI